MEKVLSSLRMGIGKLEGAVIGYTKTTNTTATVIFKKGAQQ